MSSLSPQVSPVQNNTGKETFENKDVKKREILPKKKNKSLKICFGKKNTQTKIMNETEKVSEKEEEEPSAGSAYKIRNTEDKPEQLNS